MFELGVRAWCSSVVFERGVRAQSARILIILLYTCEQHSISSNHITQIRANNTPSILIISLKYVRTTLYRSLVALYTQELQMHLYRRTYQHSNTNKHNTGTHHQSRISDWKNMHSHKPELAQSCEGCHG